MKVEPVPFAFPAEPPRQGVHASTILKDLLKGLDPQRYGKPITDETKAAFERGFALEDMLKVYRLWPAHLLLQQQFVADGIIRTLDGFDAREEWVYESKCTLLSSNNPILGPKYIGWKWQLMDYVKTSGARGAYLDILHLCGDWSPPRTIPPKRWRWVFEPHELESNRQMILRHRDRMAKEGRL